MEKAPVPGKNDLVRFFYVVVMFVEGYIFQALFVYFICQSIFLLMAHSGRFFGLLQPGYRQWVLSDLLFIFNIVFLVVLVFFDFMVAYSLHRRKNLREHPMGFLEIVIPALGTFGNLLYNVVPFWPETMNSWLVTPEYLELSLAIGAWLSLVGVGIGVWAILNLRDSFGIFVQVRDIVVKGPYRSVRHPMYLGHILIDVGFFLMSPSVWMFALSSIVIILTLYRAVLEERKFVLFCPQYSLYQRVTPFLFPWPFRVVN